MRRVLITGASRGIGRAIADAYAHRGDEVIAPPRRELDLADSGSVGRWCRGAGMHGIDVLVNNAGINELRAIADLDEAAWSQMECINLRSPLALMRAVMPGMQVRGWGRIVNIASLWAHAAKERRGGYAATKAGLVAATRVAALEGAPAGVLVNAVSPGFTATELTTRNNPPVELAAISRQIPLGRLADPAEIARVVVWLGSEENTYITGQAIQVDGGYSLP